MQLHRNEQCKINIMGMFFTLGYEIVTWHGKKRTDNDTETNSLMFRTFCPGLIIIIIMETRTKTLHPKF